MDFFQAARDARTRRRGSTPILAVIVAVLAMAFATPAQAHEPYIAKAWGLNNSGQLGDGTNTGPEQCGPEKAACSTTPVEVSGLSGVVAVAGGPVLRNHFSLALLNGGKVDAWGENGSGQLGDGTTANSDVPVAVKELSGATAIAAGKEHALALLANGTVEAWGEGFRGQLGDGTTEASDVPVAVKELTGAVAVSAGGEYSLALLSSGTVEAWGANDSGQLGDGTTTNSDVPVAVSGLSGVVAISAGSRSALALLSGGTVVAWGNNPSGQLGDGTTEASDVPVAVNGLSNVGAISAGEEHGLALLKDGTVKAWGLNEKGQLGDGASTGPESCGTLPPHPCSKTPLAVSGLSGVSAVSGGGQYSLALRSDGAVEAWGANGDGQLGDGTSLGPEPCGLGACSTIPGAVSKLGGVKGISGGGQHSLAFGPPPPSVTAISPQQGKKTGAGTKVTITGAEFEEAARSCSGRRTPRASRSTPKARSQRSPRPAKA
jgi:alpha-tubulin suppressor-like RCC1 family protein